VSYAVHTFESKAINSLVVAKIEAALPVFGVANKAHDVSKGRCGAVGLRHTARHAMLERLQLIGTCAAAGRNGVVS